MQFLTTIHGTVLRIGTEANNEEKVSTVQKHGWFDFRLEKCRSAMLAADFLHNVTFVWRLSADGKNRNNYVRLTSLRSSVTQVTMVT